jgi:hypothetical protein
LDGGKPYCRQRSMDMRSGPFTPKDSMVWDVDLAELTGMIERGEI